jgi:HNH endonuclease
LKSKHDLTRLNTSISNTYQTKKYENMNCLFCDNPLDNSDEHIIPDSLNGKLHSKNIICYTCNSEIFGLKIDPIAKEFFSLVLLALQFKNAPGRTFEDINGDLFLVKKDGKITEIRPKVEKYQEYLTVSGPPEDTIKQFAKIARTLEKEGKRIKEVQLCHITEPLGNLKIEANFKVSPKLILLLNKIAIEFYGFKQLPIKKIESLAKKIKNLDSTLSNIRFCNFNQEYRKFGDSEISHLIQLFSINKKLIVYIELFNIICAAVMIDSNFEGNEIDLQYYQDAITGDTIEYIEKLNQEYIGKLFDNNVDDYAKINFDILVNRVFQSKRKRDISNEIKDKLNKLENDLKERLNKNLITNEEYADKMIIEGSKIIAEVSIANPYLFDDLDDVNNTEINYLHSNMKELDFEEFCINNRNLIGTIIKINDDVNFKILEFEKTFLMEKNGIEIVKVNVIVDNGIKKLSLPYREAFQFIGIKPVKQTKVQIVKLSTFRKKKKMKLRKGKGLKIANKMKKRRRQRRREKTRK